ncbi:ZIP Zinc transporter [Tubulinosema ratisbonensis]|uniref:ZIP Zinc transporter n=1 Tax=Tubulinosema ratisbonensis TaxID=291195 RepID=A0A437AQ35_9MICR|nr:ZIP Zinc transporter [Tubulinosema ratisbonensis]
MIIASFIFSIVAFFISFLSSKKNNIILKEKYRHYLVSFSAGIMLTTLFNDLFPHVFEHNHSHSDHKFALSPFICLLTFTILFAFNGIFKCHSHGEETENEVLNHESENSFFGSKFDNLKYKKIIEASIFTALFSLHSFLECTGTFTTTRAIGLLVHKILDSIFFGSFLNTLETPVIFNLICCFINSFMTPLPFIFFKSESFSNYEPLFNGLGCGSLVFITFAEMLPHVFEHKKIRRRLVSLLFFIIGISLTFGLNQSIDLFEEKITNHN